MTDTKRMTLADELRALSATFRDDEDAVDPFHAAEQLRRAAAALEESERIQAMEPESWAEREGRIAWEDRLEREYKARLDRQQIALEAKDKALTALRQIAETTGGKPEGLRDIARLALAEHDDSMERAS